MAWLENRARTRITGFMESVPQGDIVVEDFETYLKETRLDKSVLASQDSRSEAALLKIPRNRAITTNGVHVYANLVDFNDVLVDAGRETEASHRRALEFLHTHYSACDSLIAEFEIQRVDFHGSRLHAVVLSPEGLHNESERVRNAVAFAASFREMVDRLSSKYPEFRTGVRIGIDTGPAVAIDGGKGDEPEPLFIGSPANHAAKLANGSEPGVFLSKRALRVSQLPSEAQDFTDWLNPDDDAPLRIAFETSALQSGFSSARGMSDVSSLLETAYRNAVSAVDEWRVNQAAFKFHHREPPLRNINFSDHPPSNSIRMPLASLFADLDGFTKYIDEAIVSGTIAQAVANLHVLRAEMAAVLREDFGGRKVRFIGDCIHGLLVVGTKYETNGPETVRDAIFAAAGVRSSFELCKGILPGINDLGIAIGIDFGTTPISRIGLRGISSVRSAASRATCVSEEEQRLCEDGETRIGVDAHAQAPAIIREAFGKERRVVGLTFPVAEVLFGTMPSPYISKGETEPMRAHQGSNPPMRAHSS